MNILNKISFTLAAVLIGSMSYGQNPVMNDQANTTETAQSPTNIVDSNWLPSMVPDGIIDHVAHDNILLPIRKIREIDIAWEATVWEEIDIRQKENMAFRYTGDQYTGGGAFIEILNNAIRKGQIRAYRNVDDRFTTPIKLKDFDNVLGIGSDTTYVTNPITGEQERKIQYNQFNVNSVTRFEVKEKWIFDRNTGRMVVRLVGIAPLKDLIDPNTGKYISSSPLYWLYYPDLRKVLVNYEVYNPRNEVHRMTWTDFLDGHYYESFVIKTSLNNPLDQLIPKQNTLRSLAEGRQQLDEIINREMDMWEE